MRRMSVEKPHPKISRDSFDPLQQTSQGGATRRVDRLSRPCLLIPEVHPIVGGILADQIDLFHSFGGQVANLSFYRLNRPAAMSAAHLRDHTKTARVITSLRNFQVGIVRWSQSKTRRGVIRYVSRLGRDKI